MRDESLLIPYAATRLEFPSLMILSPHPDDEIFGCAPLLLEGIRCGAEIQTIILSGGQAQGDPVERAEESREAARRLGAPEPVFLKFRDRGLQAGDPELKSVLEDLLKTHRPSVLAVPSPAEIHPDHRAVALSSWTILQKILRTDPTLLPNDFRLAACEISAPLRPNVLIDTTASWEQILNAACAFSSQNKIRPYLQVLEAMATIRCLTLPSEISKAAGYFVVDLDFIRSHDLLEWAARQGPSAGLEKDQAGIRKGEKNENSWWSRFQRLPGKESSP